MDYIENLIIWTFFLFGLYEFFRNIVHDFLKNEKGNENTYLMVVVKDGEDYIEGLLRLETLNNTEIDRDYIKQILVVDLNSKDETKDIIKSLEYKNGYIKLVDFEELGSILKV